MDCMKYTEMIPLYILKELTPKESDKVQRHLESCLGCKKEFREYKEMIEVLNSDSEVNISKLEAQRVKEEVYRSVLSSSIKGNKTASLNRYILQAAAAMIIFFTGYFAASYYGDTLQTHTAGMKNTKSELVNVRSFETYKHTKKGFKLIAKGKIALNDKK